MAITDARTRRSAALTVPTNVAKGVSGDFVGALTALLADVFVLYVKTKNFQWHMTGPHFSDYHLLLDD
jgi:starvation-inducible DNA-binding protein